MTNFFDYDLEDIDYIQSINDKKLNLLDKKNNTLYIIEDKNL